jgi:hypothetical protein
MRDDGRALGVRLIEVDVDCELAELASNRRDHHVLDGEFDLGMGRIQGPGAHMEILVVCSRGPKWIVH